MSKGTIFYATIFIALTILGGISLGYKGETALFPMIVIAIGILLALIKLITLIKPRLAPILDPQGLFESAKTRTGAEAKESIKEDLKKGSDRKKEVKILVWGILLVFCIYLLGFYLASPIFAFLFITIIGKQRISIAIAIAVSLPVLIYLLFHMLLRITLFPGKLFF
jgi:hypothetical protein